MKFQFFFKKEAKLSAPLDGIFHHMLKKSDIIQTKEVIVTQSSIFNGVNDVGDHIKDAYNLVYCRNETGRVSSNQSNSYFDIFFPRYLIELTNYTFMATKNDNEIPRSWSVFCLENEEMITLDEEINSSRLCGGKLGNDKESFCGSYDKQIFQTTHNKLCQKIRFQLTGLNSSNKYFFVLSGIELFGKLFQIVSHSCFNQHNIKYMISFLFFLTVYS